MSDFSSSTDLTGKGRGLGSGSLSEVVKFFDGLPNRWTPQTPSTVERIPQSSRVAAPCHVRAPSLGCAAPPRFVMVTSTQLRRLTPEAADLTGTNCLTDHQSGPGSG